MDSTAPIRTFVSPHAIVLAVLSGLAIILLIVPFIWHYRNRNVGACSLIFYITFNNLITFINAIIWPGEDYDSWWMGYGLCDVEAKIEWPLTTGIACATLCITWNLANVLDVDRAAVSETKITRRKKALVDCLICFGIPILQIGLHYIIQPNRYYITAIGGCLTSFDNSWPTIVIMFMWPLLFSLINCYYAILVIYRLHKYRTQFAHILSNSTSGLTLTRFLRLFIMSLTLLLIYTPVSIYFFVINVNIQWLPYSWSLIHYPSEMWNAVIFLPTQGARTFDHYVPIAMAVFVFFYFGMGGDAVEIYRRCALKVGVGRVFPSLQNKRRASVDSDSVGIFRKFSLIRWMRRYFERVRKGSGSVGLNSSAARLKTITTTSTGRKLSAHTTDDIDMEDISPTSFITTTSTPNQLWSQQKPLSSHTIQSTLNTSTYPAPTPSYQLKSKCTHDPSSSPPSFRLATPFDASAPLI